MSYYYYYHAAALLVVVDPICVNMVPTDLVSVAPAVQIYLHKFKNNQTI